MDSVPPGWDSRLTFECVLAGQGIDPRSQSPVMPVLVAAARRALARAPGLLEPAAVTRLLAVRSSGAAVVLLEDGTRLAGEGPARHLAGADRVLVGACTVGAALDREAAALLPGDPVTALAIDGLGCAAVEALAAAIERQALAAARDEGCEATTALSPGGEEWPLGEGQRAIFAALGPGAPVRLGEAGQMWPVKSISFVLGLGPGVTRHEAAECEGCGARERCRWRTARQAMGGL